jgi:Caspase domain
MRKALVVGIDYYEHITPLFGCVNDAHLVNMVLGRNSDGTVNFAVKLLTGTGLSDSLSVSRTQLRESIRDLFLGESDTALFWGFLYVPSKRGIRVFMTEKQ